MATIKYQNNGEFIDIEVTEEFAIMYREMEKADRLLERKETRRHQSLDKSLEKCYDIPDKSVNIEEQAEKNDMISQLFNALEVLEPQQIYLIKQLFYRGRTISELAEQYRVSKSAICIRLNKIYAKLKKVLD